MLILVRHGRTAANAQGLLQGRGDLPLDEVGRQQAQQVANSIGAVDHVISSPLARARETAACFGVPITIDDRWIELDFGIYESEPLVSVPAQVWGLWRSDADFEAPGAESMRALDTRVRSACVDIVDLARTANVVVVSHVSPIKAAVAWALGGDISMSWRIYLDQAAVCRISVGGGQSTVRSVNEVLYQRPTIDSG